VHGQDVGEFFAEDQTEDVGLEAEEEIDEEPIMRPHPAHPKRGRAARTKS
jgi:hypothetical protein